MDADQQDALERFIGSRLGRRKDEDPLRAVNLLDLTPVRAAEWEEVEDRVVIERPRPPHRWFRTPLQWVGFLMSTRRIRLDPKGSFVWRALDGRETVRSLAARLRTEFGDEIEPAEERMGTLIRQLRSQELVVYPGWDDPGAEPT